MLLEVLKLLELLKLLEVLELLKVTKLNRYEALMRWWICEHFSFFFFAQRGGVVSEADPCLPRASVSQDAAWCHRKAGAL